MQKMTAGVTKQKTLKTEIDCTGVAMHSGRKAKLTLKPAEGNTGIRIYRTDLVNGARESIVNWANVVDTQLATTVGNDHGATVSTVEHLVAALAGCEAPAAGDAGAGAAAAAAGVGAGTGVGGAASGEPNEKVPSPPAPKLNPPPPPLLSPPNALPNMMLPARSQTAWAIGACRRRPARRSPRCS